MQDIVSPNSENKKTIRQVSINKVVKRPLAHQMPGGDVKLPRPTPPVYRRPSLPKGALWTFAIVGALVLFFIISLAFSGATLAVTPRQEPVQINASYIASKSDPARLTYDVLILSKESSREVKATGEEEVKKSASGRIVVYNEYSSAAQKLVAKTRFEAPDGLIYRISEQVIVPGMKTSGGKITPGSIEVTVTADQPGENYNIGLVDFTVPGFKGSPQYDKFYARSKTPMTGGMIGKVKTVNEGDTAPLRQQMRELLENDLREQLVNSLPKGVMVFADSARVYFESLPSESAEGGAIVKEKASLQGVIFDKNLFAAFLAEEKGLPIDEGTIEVLDQNKLSFKILASENADLSSFNEITFELSGEPVLVWTFDENQLSADLAGKNKKEMPGVLVNYPGIQKARIIMRPPWKQTFPASAKKIKINNEVTAGKAEAAN